jgi:hypothetical protein
VTEIAGARESSQHALVAEIEGDHHRRLVNQRRFRHHFVECLCERGCLVCAYTGLVSKGHAKLGERSQQA